jgi:hypothetical protein
MDPILAKALNKKLELEKELAKLDQFIQMYRELERTNREAVDIGGNSQSADAEPPNPLQAISESAGMIRPRGRPADFARIMETILKDAGHPMQRGQLVEEVERRGHSIPSEDKPRYLGTILWRREDLFVSVEGRGYWLKDVELPPEKDPDLLGEPTETVPGMPWRRL